MELKEAVLSYNKELAIKETRIILENGCSIKEFYQEYIFTLLNDLGKEIEPEVYDVAKEHLISAIIRTIIEICYEYILKEKKEDNNQSVLVCTLENELHELPPRIISDFLTLEGYRSYFLGANIPNEDIMSAIRYLDVDYIALSVTNHLHLTKLKGLVDEIKSNTDTKIIVGGKAVINNLEYVSKLNIDYILKDVNEIGEIK